jgi:hypothetical protein
VAAGVTQLAPDLERAKGLAPHRGRVSNFGELPAAGDRSGVLRVCAILGTARRTEAGLFARPGAFG